MRAIILAAGRGSRMGDATDVKPKCMTEIEGKTLLDWQVSAINKAGIDDITVVRGYKPELISNKRFKTVDNTRWAETNMVASLFCAQPVVSDTLVSYSDILYNPEHVARLAKADGDIVITADLKWLDLWKLRFDKPLDDAETFKSNAGVLMEIGGKTEALADIEAQYMGLLKFSKVGWDLAYNTYKELPTERRDKLDMTGLLRLLLTKKVMINVVFVDGKWCEVDNQNDLSSYRNALSKGSWSHDWRWSK